jgi:uncharacterized protein (TIGR01777 family)
MKKLKILVIGGTGFIGRVLSKALLHAGHTISVLSRSPAPDIFPGYKVSFIQADVTVPGEWQGLVPGFDVVINLAGVPIFRRWTAGGKKKIIDSRILATRNIVEALAARKAVPQQFFSISGVGYYGFHGDELLDEDSSPGYDFLAEVAARWEAEAERAIESGTRLVICRLGHVLGTGGGVFPKLATLASLHLASRWGSGNQWISWVHVEDIARCIIFLLDNTNITGPVNVTTPNPVRNRDMMALLAELSGKRVLIPPVPEPVLRLITGEFASVFINGQRAIPQKLINAGCTFDYPKLQGALEALLS